jgi:hypothetical protein
MPVFLRRCSMISEAERNLITSGENHSTPCFQCFTGTAAQTAHPRMLQSTQEILMHAGSCFCLIRVDRRSSAAELSSSGRKTIITREELPHQRNLGSFRQTAKICPGQTEARVRSAESPNPPKPRKMASFFRLPKSPTPLSAPVRI